MAFLGGLFGKKDKEPPKKGPAPKPVMPLKKSALPIKKAAMPLKKAPGAQVQPAAAKPAAPAPREEASKKSDIDFLREQLREIQEVMGATEAVPAAPASDKRGFLDIPLNKVLKILPPEFAKPDMPGTAQMTVTVIVEDLFEQLRSGRVTTSLRNIINEIPEGYLAPEAHKHAEDSISLPLSLVVSAMEPGELQRRTSNKDRDLGVRGMPNVFSKDQLTPQAAAAMQKAEETAAQQPPAAETSAPVPEPAAEVAVPEPEIPAVEESAPAEVVEEEPVAAETPAEEPVAEEKPAAEETEVSADDLLKSLLEEAPEAEAETVAAGMEEVAIEETAAAEAIEPAEEAAEAAPEEPVYEEEPPAEEIPEAAAEEPVAEEAPAEEPVQPEEAPAEESPFASIMAELEEPAAVEETVEETVEEAVEEAVEAPVVTPPEPVAAEPVPPSAAEIKEGQYLFLHGVDLNAANAEELTHIEGINHTLAEKIVKARQESGQFFYLTDLMRVPGLGRKSFERLTGLKVNADTFRYADLIHEILGPPKHGIPNVKDVVQRFTALEDFEGCIITHADGYTMASSWENPKEEALGAFTPQMFKKVAHYISHLDMGALASITFTIEQQPFTIICSGCVYLIAIHVPNRFNKRSVSIAQAIGAEIGRRLTSARDKEE